MSGGGDGTGASRPALLCFDGSDDARGAIAEAGTVLGLDSAVVLTVWEPFANWEPYDPATILSAPVSRLASRALDLDEIAEELAVETMAQGISLARAAGFAAEGRAVRGKPWRMICEIAEEVGVATIVVGARGLSRVQSVLLGSVSTAVAVHAGRPLLIVPRRRG
jgi:nucleotide-binding universal stress UspA family protein